MIHRLPFLDHDRWYVITSSHGEDENRAPWQYRSASLHGPNTQASIEWSLLIPGYRFGLGVSFGRNGSESDVGLDIHLGLVGNVYLRLRAPWTSWARVSRDKKNWYEPRETELRLFPHEGCILAWALDMPKHSWSSGELWWRRFSFTVYDVLGPTDHEETEGERGETKIPLPEGNYVGTWVQKTMTWRHRRPLGTWRDRILGVRRRTSYDLSIEGGIPVEGKGENSWDCGMDGLFGCGGSSVEEAVGSAVSHVLRDRRRYGGPHNLERPMTVREASAR